MFARTGDGTTPLYVASRRGHVGVIEVLLSNGADVMTRKKNGSTPLFAAVEAGKAQVGNIAPG